MWFLNAFATLKNLFLKKPLLVVWNVTDRCNQDCKYCNAHSPNSKDKPLSEMLDAIKTLKELKIKYAYIQGGEPLLRNDLIEILEALLEAKIKPTLITNGTLLSEKIINFIKDRAINLSISLETLDPEKYKQLTGNDGLETKLNTIRKLGKMAHQGNWSITTTVTRLNYNEVYDLEKFARDYGFMYAIRCYMHDIGTYGKNDVELNTDEIKEEIIAIFNNFASKSKRENYPAYLIYREVVNYLRGKPMDLCDATRYSIVLNSDGSFSPCIEHTNLRISGTKREILTYLKSKNVQKVIRYCNEHTPCFHGCARNIGILYKYKFNLLLHFVKLLRVFGQYNAFF